jgi:hypothetical protein
MGRNAFLAAVACSVFGLAATPGTAPSGRAGLLKPNRWVGTMQGGETNTEHFVSFDMTVRTDDRAVTTGRFTFPFRVAPSGKVTGSGSGSGSYVTATFHRKATSNGAPFGCDVAVRAQPFHVAVGGRVLSGRLRLSLQLPDAEESNESMHCGADYDVKASTTQILDGSLRFAGGRSLSIVLRNGATLRLVKHDDYDFADPDAVPPGKGTGAADHSWTLRLRRSG